MEMEAMSDYFDHPETTDASISEFNSGDVIQVNDENPVEINDEDIIETSDEYEEKDEYDDQVALNVSLFSEEEEDVGVPQSELDSAKDAFEQAMNAHESAMQAWLENPTHGNWAAANATYQAANTALSNMQSAFTAAETAAREEYLKEWEYFNQAFEDHLETLGISEQEYNDAKEAFYAAWEAYEKALEQYERDKELFDTKQKEYENEKQSFDDAWENGNPSNLVKGPFDNVVVRKENGNFLDAFVTRGDQKGNIAPGITWERGDGNDDWIVMVDGNAQGFKPGIYQFEMHCSSDGQVVYVNITGTGLMYLAGPQGGLNQLGYSSGPVSPGGEKPVEPKAPEMPEREFEAFGLTPPTFYFSGMPPHELSSPGNPPGGPTGPPGGSTGGGGGRGTGTSPSSEAAQAEQYLTIDDDEVPLVAADYDDDEIYEYVTLDEPYVPLDYIPQTGLPDITSVLTIGLLVSCLVAAVIRKAVKKPKSE